MSRPIMISEDIMHSLIDKVVRTFKKTKLVEGKLDLSYDLEDTEATASLDFNPVAYTKMLHLVQDFDSEVAWHGVVSRTGDTDFLIEDIIVYPQEVTGATVNTDQKEYEKWLMDLDDEVFNRLRFQGHSHVNMGVSPSGVDLTHQEKIVDQLEGDDFYIFVIWNKKMQRTVKIFDMKTNTLYETDDVTVKVGGLELEDNKFLAEAHELVKNKAYSYTPTYDTGKKNKSVNKSYYDFDGYGYSGYWG